MTVSTTQLKKAYGHPSYNKLLRAYHQSAQSEIHKVLFIRKLYGLFLKEKTECKKCQKKWQ